MDAQGLGRTHPLTPTRRLKQHTHAYNPKLSKSVAKALRGAIGREKNRGIPTILFARSDSIRAFATDLDKLPPGRVR